jgi:hypothetical protein
MSVSFDEYGFFNGVWEFNQVNWAKMMSPTVPDGVMGGIGNELQVWADSSGMMVHVKTGECRVRGHRGSLESPVNLTIATADSVNPRIDLVVARVTYGSPSTMVLDVLTGTAAEEPVVPEVTQVAGDTWEIALASVKVIAGATSIVAGDVSDYRYVYSGSGVGAVKLKNGEADDLSKGELVIMKEDEANTVVRCGLNDAPIGVVETNTIAAGATGNIQTISGAQVEIKCDEDAVSVGDTLIPSTTAGQARTGGGYGAGYALEAKEAGAVGNVKAILAVMYLRNKNQWYLMDGITEENVVVAYQFKGAESRESALKNINSGAVYPLTATDTVTWTTGKGLFFPADIDCYITNTELTNQHASIVACAFGYSDVSTGSVTTAGVALNRANPYKYFAAMGGRYYNSNYYYHGTSIPQSASTGDAKYMAPKNVGGVLACDWSAYKVWYNGLSQSLTNADNMQMRSGQWTYPRVFTTCSYSDFKRGTMYLSALVFYNCVLTDAQHVQLANQINAL